MFVCFLKIQPKRNNTDITKKHLLPFAWDPPTPNIRSVFFKWDGNQSKQSDNEMFLKLINAQRSSKIFEHMEKLADISSIKSTLFGHAILAALNQSWDRAPFTTVLWALVFTFSYFPAAAQKPHATLFIIQPTSVCNSCPVLLLASHSEVTSLCSSTTALAFQHGSRTAAQWSSVLLKSQRGPDQSRAGREPGSGPSQPRQLGAAYNKWETMRTSTPPTLCMWMLIQNWN